MLERIIRVLQRMRDNQPKKEVEEIKIVARSYDPPKIRVSKRQRRKKKRRL